jgi:predicted nucleic acid-binding protein
MKRVFADSFYFISLANTSDCAHADAVAVLQEMDYPVLTTTWVLLEVADALSSAENKPLFTKLLKTLQSDRQIEVLPATQASFDAGLRLFTDRMDKDWSLTDCISFVVMKEHKITDALTGDHHFEQAGFKALLK